MNASDLIAELANRSGIPSLKLDDHGMARLAFEQGIEVDMEEDKAEGVLHLYTHLAGIPADGREAFYAWLLEANLFCGATLGATLALDRGRGEVLLCRKIDLAATDFLYFFQCLDKLVTACETLRQEMRSVLHADANARVSEPAPVYQGAALQQWA